MVVYDAAIIGAGADGLAAAAVLARAGQKAIVVERNAQPGGRTTTREFHPGFRASAYADEIAPVPREIFWSLDLARHGALFLPPRSSLALWQGGRASRLVLEGDANGLIGEARRRTGAMLARAQADVARAPFLPSFKPQASWPAEDWAGLALRDLTQQHAADDAESAHLIAWALAGRAADPDLAGSAVHLLAPGSGGSGAVRGGLGVLTAALEAAAREAGATLSFGLDVADIRRARGRVSGLTLADGSEIAARAVISTLDLKRTFLSLFSWTALPRRLVGRVNGFRMAAGAARLLVALDALPEIPGVSEAPEAAHGPIQISSATSSATSAFVAWRNATLPDALPLTVRFPSAVDPSLAPAGAATMTVTIGAVPGKLFDGAWTRERRDLLRDRALKAIEAVLPGVSDRVRATELITPPDIEEALGLSDGDLWGGDIAPDQLFATRPWTEGPAAPRTPIRGLYLAGPSTTAGVLASCASGVAAARALLADARFRWRA